MNPRCMRALVLLEQKRFDLADRELRAGLAEEPDDPFGHALLALCLAHQEKLDDAIGEAQQAVRLAPTLSFCHYALASVLDDRGELKEAEASVSEAIRLDPYDASYFAQLAAIRFNRRLWQESLESAEQGLRIEPEHVDCNNLRAMALVKLGRKQEAGQTIASALAREPGNATTHANQGWALLEQGDPKRAAEHFKEALRIDPMSEWARAGIVESLKARHIIYRLMLRYFLWMSKLSAKAQWCVLIGLVVGQMVLSRLSEASPTLALWVTPLVVILFVFLVLTWIADPLFNLLLRCDRYGRLVLTPAQMVSSNWLGACLLAMLACLVAGLICGRATQRGSLLVLSAVQFGLLVLPVAATFQCSPGGPRRALGAFALLLAVIGPGMTTTAAVRPQLVAGAKAVDLNQRYFIPGVILSTWLGVGLSQRWQR